MNNFCIYQHRRHDTNEIFYVGIGTEKRPYHKHDSSRSKCWHYIVEKTGYSVEVLSSNLTREEAIELERYLIKYYGRRDLKMGNLVNMTDGGEGTVGVKYTEERRQKLSASGKGKHSTQLLGIPKTKEHRQKMSENNAKSRIILDTVYGIFYNSATEASKTYNMTGSSLARILRGERTNHTNLIYA